MFDFIYNPPLAHFILRIAVGGLFVCHGYPKLFKNFSGFSSWLETLGIKPGKFWTAILIGVEFFGGIFLILGVFVQVIGLLIAADMLVAMWKAKWGKIGLMDPGGWELDLLLFASGIALALTGGGAFSLIP